MIQDGLEKYAEIINLSRPPSRHPRMPADKRAAQFAPFAALSGYGEAVYETERLTDRRIDLDDYEKEELGHRLQYAICLSNEEPKVSITYFVEDIRKSGGEYMKHFGVIKIVDEYERLVIFKDGTMVKLDDIYSIEGEIFGGMEWD